MISVGGRKWRTILGLSLALVGAARAVATPPLAHAEFLPHSHNDYQQKRPLQLALEQGYRSLEVDVAASFFGPTRVVVTHWGLIPEGTLQEMYLDPLQKRVGEKGSVYGDGKPFYLWIEIRRFALGSGGITEALRELLARYPMLTRFSPRGVAKAAPVVVILTGYSPHKSHLTIPYAVPSPAFVTPGGSGIL
jgi:hypothetical protein